jgi:hypothetical protein
VFENTKVKIEHGLSERMEKMSDEDDTQWFSKKPRFEDFVVFEEIEDSSYKPKIVSRIKLFLLV